MHLRWSCPVIDALQVNEMNINRPKRKQEIKMCDNGGRD